jgi:hypothetical protein
MGGVMTRKEDLDYLFSSLITDTDALEDAKMTLEAIKETASGVYDEMIDESIALIDKALGNLMMDVIGRIVGDEDWYITERKE